MGSREQSLTLYGVHTFYTLSTSRKVSLCTGMGNSPVSYSCYICYIVVLWEPPAFYTATFSEPCSVYILPFVVWCYMRVL